jgi:hypothetical protein
MTIAVVAEKPAVARDIAKVWVDGIWTSARDRRSSARNDDSLPIQGWSRKHPILMVEFPRMKDYKHSG